MLDKPFVLTCFVVAVVITGVTTWFARGAGGSDGTTNKNFRIFQRTYLCVYLLATMADWLQGPYVYALYESYGIDRQTNAQLFTAGFGASAVFGTFIGSWADRLGRRKLAMLYCLLYIVHDATKHVNSFSILMIGRMTGGISTSLLFSVFDSWMVSEHSSRGFHPALMGGTFSLAIFGNGMVAIAAGELGQVLADVTPLTNIFGTVHYAGYTAPFDASIVFCVLCLILMRMTWTENYGNKAVVEDSAEAVVGLSESLSQGLRVLKERPQALCVGMVCSLFEASMFIFVFNWTPALREEVGIAASNSLEPPLEPSPDPPFGHIFASFMVMSMLGSQVFLLVSSVISVEQVGMLTLVISAFSLFTPVMTGDVHIRFLSFMVFEFCVGMYFPMIGTLKSIVVPEEVRSTVYNLYRVPLNTIVVLVLVMNVDMQSSFLLTSFMMCAALVIQVLLHQYRSADAASAEYEAVDVEMDEGPSEDMAAPVVIGSSECAA